MNMVWLSGIAAIALCTVTTAAYAQSADGSKLEPGFKEKLAEDGFKLSASVTGITQGLLGGDGDKTWDASGHADLLFDVDFDKLGLNSGTTLKTHTEMRIASPQGGFGGQLLPGNVQALVPTTDAGDIEVTSFHIQQRIGKSSVLMLGKINSLDLMAGDPFFGGSGQQRFMHLAFAAPPSGVVPVTMIGGVLSHRAGQYSITAMAFDPEDRTTKYGFGGLFQSGVNLSLGVTWGGEVEGRATTLGITGTYSTKTGQNLGDILIPGAIGTSLKKGSFNLALAGSHILKESPVKAGKGLGFYYKVAVADGNPNLIQSSFIGGFSGHAMIKGRPDDSFGLGFFAYNISNVLQDAVVPLGNFQDEKGMEAWYSFALMPNVKLTPDIQIIDPARGDRSTAIIGALRLHMSI